MGKRQAGTSGNTSEICAERKSPLIISYCKILGKTGDLWKTWET